MPEVFVNGNVCNGCPLLKSSYDVNDLAVIYWCKNGMNCQIVEPTKKVTATDVLETT